MRKRGLFVRLCLRPARECRHARRTLCMFICRTANYPTLFCKIQKPTLPVQHLTNAEQMWQAHICLAASSIPHYLPTPPHPAGWYLVPRLMPALVSDRTTKSQTSCSSSPKFVSWAVIHYNTPMSAIARGSIKRNESKSHPGGFYMQRNAWLMRRSGMARVFGTLFFPFVSWSYRNNAKVAFCLFFKPSWQHQGWNFLLIWHGLCSSTRAQTRRW